jgi:hypothetical protein
MSELAMGDSLPMRDSLIQRLDPKTVTPRCHRLARGIDLSLSLDIAIIRAQQAIEDPGSGQWHCTFTDYP